MRPIASRQNPVVRMFRDLADNPDPDGARLLLDGVHLVSDARAAGVPVEIVAVSTSRLAAGGEVGALVEALERDGVEVVAADDRTFAAMSPVRTPSGIVAIALRRPTTMSEICSRPDAFVVAAVDVQEPGNVGSLVRAAEAGGVTGVLACGTSASPFSWKAVRGSMGSVLRTPVASGIDSRSAMECFNRMTFRTVAAVARGGVDPDEIDWSGRVALWLGGEGPGLAAGIVSGCTARVTIPMQPPVESLNVAAASAILVYAARRQRSHAPAGGEGG